MQDLDYGGQRDECRDEEESASSGVEEPPNGVRGNRNGQAWAWFDLIENARRDHDRPAKQL